MRVEEAILFLAVVALSLALVIVVVAPILLQKRRASLTAPKGARDLGVETAAACPACHRHQPVEFRFCPFDGTPLGIRLPIDGERDRALQSQDVNGTALAAGPGGKICPSCSRRYRLDTAVCPRDGAPLVAVN